MKRTIILLLILILQFVSKAQNSALFEKGNDFYKQGKFEEALKSYDQILRSGYESAELYYNIGNAYYKTNKYTNAILYFEKAIRLRPDDEDIKQNLELLTSNFVVDKVEPLPEFFLTTWIKFIIRMLSVDYWAYLSIGTFIVVLILMLMFLFSHNIRIKKTTFAFAVLLFLLSAISFVFTMNQKAFLEARSEAIIMTPTVAVKSSPDDKGTELFILHEGTKVTIKDEVGEWREIRIGSGNLGWVKINDLEKI